MSNNSTSIIVDQSGLTSGKMFANGRNPQTARQPGRCAIMRGKLSYARATLCTCLGSAAHIGCYMRVLHVVESTIAGVRTHVQNLVTGLDRHRFQAVVACPPRRQQSYGDDQFVNYLAHAGIPVVPVAMQRTINPVGDLAA